MNRELGTPLESRPTPPPASVPPTPKLAAHAEALEVPRVRFVESPGAEALTPPVQERPRWAPEPDMQIEPEVEKVSLDPAERIKAFNGTTGTILAQAYEVFPEMTPGVPNVHGPKAGVDPEFYRATLKWLEAEGYIRFNDYAPSAPQTDHWLYTLTSKGLGILTSSPASLKAHGENIGAAMVGAAKKGAKEGLQDLAKEVLKEGLGLATKVAMEHMQRVGL